MNKSYYWTVKEEMEGMVGEEKTASKEVKAQEEEMRRNTEMQRYVTSTLVGEKC